MTPSLREELILSHIPQVKLLPRHLHRRCPQVELDDLISAGTLGLIRAVDRFDTKRNLKLKTLAEHRIRGAMLDYLRYIDPLPRNVRRFQKQRDVVIAKLQIAGEVASHARNAQALGVSSQKYAMLSRIIAAAEPISIHESTVVRELTGWCRSTSAKGRTHGFLSRRYHSPCSLVVRVRLQLAVQLVTRTELYIAPTVMLRHFRSIAQNRKQLNVRQNLNTVFPTKSENHSVMEVAVQSA